MIAPSANAETPDQCAQRVQSEMSANGFGRSSAATQKVKECYEVPITPTIDFSSNSSGSCSSHGGVSCSAGADIDGSAICNDGWRDSIVWFDDVQACKSTKKYSPYTPSYTNSCPLNSIDAGGGSCKCNIGYRADIITNSCIEYDSYCKKTFGANSYSKNNVCDCKDGYTFSSVGLACVEMPDIIPPSDILDLKAEPGTNDVTLKWSPSTDNKAIKGYIISYDTKPLDTAGMKTDEEAPHAAQVTTNATTISNLAKGVTYYFYVLSRDTAGNSSKHWSNVATATLKDNSPPSKVQNIKIKKQGTKLNIQWDLATDNEGTPTYIVYWSNMKDDLEKPKTSTSHISVKTGKYTFKGYSKKKTYFFAIYALDKSGNFSLSADVLSTASVTK